MELRQLEYFCSVANYLNFTRAAEALHVSQPAITSSVKALEEELHVNLFIRERKRIRLTAEGRIFLEKILPVLNQLKQTTTDMQLISEHSRSILNLGVAPVSGSRLLHSLYGMFLKVHPDVTANVYEMGSYGLLEAIDSNQIELAYMVILDDVKEKYAFLPIEDSSIHVVVGRGHALADQKEISMEQLRDVPVILLPSHSFIGRKVLECYAAANIVPRVLCEPQQMSTVFNLVADEAAISFVLGDQFLKHSCLDQLISIPLKPTIPYAAGFVWKKDRQLSAAARTCIEFFSNRM